MSAGADLAEAISAAIQRHGPALEPGGLEGVLIAALACVLADEHWPALPPQEALIQTGSLIGRGIRERRQQLAARNVLADAGMA